MGNQAPKRMDRWTEGKASCKEKHKQKWHLRVIRKHPWGPISRLRQLGWIQNHLGDTALGMSVTRFLERCD